MDVRNCRTCGRLFNYIGGPANMCPACREEVEKKFQKVKEYIRENPKASIQQIADDNEVSTNQLRQWIREERLQFTDDSDIGIECENCGASIKTGRFCDNCKNSMANSLSEAIEKPKPALEQPKKKPDSKNKMHFLEK
ncbi:flagellar operon protein TIGR03826 [Pseudobutyrivibrio sp. OR37]|uniref:flagellar protein n=1 Tax=Pseudobutyrivibrio sp. OR37 TaxID=1798186 RepID=UPI0008E9D7AE|nr:flagellar protein [Pseudobutyrivibrio sp. OR37]SFH74328.1 flagellar operon protein TIGR03826 [Pseudobutyrivibrio sp. OR37]